MRFKKNIFFLKNNHSAILVSIFLLLLWLSVVLAIINKERYANIIGNWAFYFLIIEIIVKIIEIKLWKQPER